MQDYYHNNTDYVDYLERQNTESFTKYTRTIVELLSKSKTKTFLDVGCGTGIAIEEIKKIVTSEEIQLNGTDINSAAIEICKQKQLDCVDYDGVTLPYNDNQFSVVGTINVLEHTDDPVGFLTEMYRVTSLDGYILIACPNLLAITNNYHPNTSGLDQKFKNIRSIIQKQFSNSPDFKKLEPYTDKMIPDHDATVETNPVDIIKWSKQKNLKLETWSSIQMDNAKPLKKILDIYPFKLILGSCFLIFKKIN